MVGQPARTRIHRPDAPRPEGRDAVVVPGHEDQVGPGPGQAVRRRNEKIVPGTVHHTGGAEVDSALGGASEECSDLRQPGEGLSRRMGYRIGAGHRRWAAPGYKQHRHPEAAEAQPLVLHPAEPDPPVGCRQIRVGLHRTIRAACSHPYPEPSGPITPASSSCGRSGLTSPPGWPLTSGMCVRFRSRSVPSDTR